MSPSLEDELEIPPEATLMEASNATTTPTWSLQTKGTTTSIAIAVETAIRPNPRCLVVGRQAKAADLRIQHGSISRKHAALYCLGKQLVLQDFGSKKGTTVNGSLVQGSQQLHDGDEIIFGHVRETVFQVRCSGSEEDATTKDLATVDEEEEEATTTTTTQDNDPTETTPEEQPPEPGAGLTGRAKREAEIAAMMNSLENFPSYSKYVPSAADMAPRSSNNNNNNKSSSSSKPNDRSQSLAATADKGATADTTHMDHITKTAKQHRLPILERMTMEADTDRRHMVTCIGLDPSGVRFVVGTTDNTLRLYDFGGMDRLRKDPFKMIQADEGHVVSDVCYSNTGDRILVGTGSLQPFVLDRDGGEMYVTC